MEQGALREFANVYGDTEKRFIMFDRSGDKGRIMLEPNRFFEFNPSTPPNGEGPEAGEFHRVYREAMASFAAFRSMRETNSPPVTLCHIGDVKDSDSSVSKLSWDHLRDDDDEQQSSVREEDSEDIDALLYSDGDEGLLEEVEEEECSTGHTPLSEVTRDESSDEITSSFHAENSNRAVEQEAILAVASYSNRKRQRSLVVRRRKEMKKQRKERIRQTVKALQSIVPGGDSMDPAIVLDEAILYMKVLQMRVRQLETTRQEDLSNAARA
ncbi:hypothetical protein SELMODRAFT_447051 [Selaginella moellendorffii]|uniref:BHLH domain-containing protein n=1 Tax=Selaginella moellendorffii TaxID=88036 RepID=D8SWA6_SELML|nr:transcription factor bHLH143 [Selaginella moellendorffii]EFJ11263.1 hypothetical protein SELMODRAFT_447051 [Selaginella moellendorffii]|eukprot:XP_002987688.1 transcription factor bHLH143 [Selaginella moellendorffii]